ncbi:MAG: class I SAM-dependent methyltransferase [Thiotrichaceae bacterium]|nr:class I SAM-dependent methyltransferase [Thiotrichaceae bacterium]
MTKNISEHYCPLCDTSVTDLFYQDKRNFYPCSNCSLVFIPAHQFLTLEQEKSIYDKHNNSPDDPHYRAFLNRLFKPVSERLAPESLGLDFGSGPGPTLSIMFTEIAHEMNIYDVFYANDTNVLNQKYDFITASEVVEHLHHPKEELERLWRCLKPDGILGIMTKRVIDQQAFSSWHYKNDPTHVCFFSIETFQWLADHWRASISFAENDVVLLIKNGSSE